MSDAQPEPDAMPSAAEAWAALAAARSGDQLCRAWLQVLCGALLPVRAGVLLTRQPDGAYAPVAGVPAARDLAQLAPLGDLAVQALRQREGVLQRDALGHARLAYPLPLTAPGTAAPVAAVVLDLGDADEAAVQRAQQQLHWGAGWLVDLMRQLQQAQGETATQQGRFVLDTVLALLNEPGEREAALALVNRLGRELGCHQVQLATPQGRSLRIRAVSHAAVFDERTNLSLLSLQALHEAYDQRRRIVWPAPDAATGTLVSSAHARYAAEAGAAALCSLPLPAPDQVAGVLLLERDRPFSPQEGEFLDALALALAPLLALQHDAQQGAWARARRTTRRWLGLASDGSHLAAKLGLVTVAGLLAALALVPAPLRVSAPAVVEGARQRAAVAPFEGYLREAPARAGDVVQAGQLLARLDDKDLRLEQTRWEAELEVALRKEREAMARGNRVDQRLAAAQANQARAQLDLALAKLERVAVTAPFDAVVVQGDLSQQLGSPLEQGKVLFELAPLDAWRVILKVDERDIALVQPGARGELVLASLPGQSWAFTVRKLTPVSVQQDGSNHFRVEAELQGATPRFSPNMEGVGKIDAGQASLLQAWTRPLRDWARLAWWKAMP